MRAVRNVAPGVEVVDVDGPDGEGELIKVSAVSICASDLLYIGWGSEQIAGHEIAGVLEDGTAVAVEAIFGCGTCDYCLQGHYNRCAKGVADALGMVVDGGMSEYFRAPQRALVPLPEGLEVTDASLVEPGSVAWHACRTGEIGPETRVVVVGAGPIGLLAVLAAQSQGAAEVALEARHPHQRELGERFGATEPTGLYDVVIEAAGSESSLHRSVELSRPGGTVVIVGVFGPDVAWPHQAAFNKEVKTAPALGYCGHDGVREFGEVAAMFASRPEITEALISHRYGIEDAAQAFDTAGNRSQGTLKVVVHP